MAVAAPDDRRVLRGARARRGRGGVGVRRHPRGGQGRAERRALRAQGPRVLGERRAEPERSGVLDHVPRRGQRAHRAADAPEPRAVRDLRRGEQAEADPGDGARRGHDARAPARGARGRHGPRCSGFSTKCCAASRRCTPPASATSTSSRRTSSCAATNRPSSSTSGSRVDQRVLSLHVSPGAERRRQMPAHRPQANVEPALWTSPESP